MGGPGASGDRRHPAAGRRLHRPVGGSRQARGRQLDPRRLAADARLAGPPSAVMPMRQGGSTMESTVPAGHALEATRKVRWGAGLSCVEPGAVPQL